MAASRAEQPSYGGLDGPALRDALLADKNIQPITSVDDMAGEGVFDSDEELDEFLSWVSAERRANLA